MEPLLSSDPSVVGSYRLVGRLGGGGMGVVYLAEDAEGGRVAVKLLSGGPGMGPQLRERLAREARSLQLLNSPHVVRILDVDVDAEAPYLVMSFIEGLPLDRAVPEGGLPQGEAQVLGAQLAAALAEAHSHGIVHRDLKPNNVILGPSGVTLVDFGIASLEEEGATALTRDGGFLGSLAWLAPEVIAGGSADERSDVFGLGLVLGFLALGRHPYGGGRPEAVMYRIMHEQPDLAGAAPAVVGPIEAALRRDPDARPTAAQLAAGLREPGVFPAPVSARRSRRAVPWLLAGVAAVAIAGASAVAAAAGGTAAEDASSAAPSPASSTGPQQPAPPESFDFTSTCTWSQRELTFDEEGMMGPAVFRADCGPGADIDATAVYTQPDYDAGETYGRLAVQGEIGGAPFSLGAQYEFQELWEGTFNGVPVLLSLGRDGNGFTVLDGSSIGNGAVRAVGPQPDINYDAYGPWDYWIWDEATVVTGRFYGDPNVTAAQGAALCQLMTVGIPASSIGALD